MSFDSNHNPYTDESFRPARSARAITADNSNDLPDGVCRAIYVGTAGNVRLLLRDDTTAVMFSNLAAGEHPFQVRRVLTTDLTAAGLVALY